ncbi:hypothetical protein ACFOQM_09845 [Paenibacillus sp. GCM10012307]|uniref:Uncharacterized protein n=1 Tax=Paenibacillus roseus TaxID=2798579 RepID=A0A934MP17_9BACL|nr:hypothetical protein [Paenibacillus roseus]MBJ6361586.1 hypothetical protein [Paenibacillus roseus]
MITDEQLNALRVQGTLVRVVRDYMEQNDVIGIVVAWSEDQVMVRKKSRRIVKLSRNYRYEPALEERSGPAE